MKRALLTLCAALLGSIASGQVVIDADRLPPNGEWHAGYPGGIPDTSGWTVLNVKDPPYNAVGDGVTDDTAAIQAAINDDSGTTIIYLPAGTYKTTSQLSSVDDWTILIKGDGSDLTKIEAYGTSGSIIAFDPVSSFSRWINLTSDGNRGDTVLNVDSGDSDFTSDSYDVGDWIAIEEADPDLVNISTGDIPSYMTGGLGPTTDDESILQWTQIVGKGASTLTIDPPLYHDFRTAYTARTGANRGPQIVGMEGIQVERMVDGGTHNIYMQNIVRFWFYDVWSTKAKSWHLRIDESCYGTIQRCRMNDSWNGGGNSSYGVGLYKRCGQILVVDNIMWHCRHSMITEYGGWGNVFIYNYSRDGRDESGAADTSMMYEISHHGGYAAYNLWEGNVVGRIGVDIFGQSKHNTFFRNWATRESDPDGDGIYDDITSGERCIDIHDDHREINVVANVMGISGQSHDGFKFGSGQFETIVKYGYASDGDTNHAGVDPLAESTTHWHGNWDSFNNSVVTEAGYSTAYPDSYFYDSKPAWFGDMTWPPIDPDSAPYTHNVAIIPAMVRDQGGSVEAPPGAAYTGRLRFNGTGSQPVLTDQTGSVPIKTN